MASGILNVNKSAGPSSFSVVRAIRRLPGVSKAGHGGTLDPAAEGVLPILINSATRLMDFMHAWTKTYVATIKFGFTSDTGDREGSIRPSGDPGTVTAERIEALLPRFIGQIPQVPPMYSALKRGGETLYRKARRGETVEREPRLVEVFSIRLIDFDASQAWGRLEVSSGPGMYVRSLVQDLGVALDCGAYLSALTRIAFGPLRLEEAVTTAALAEAGEGWFRWLLPTDLPIREWPALALDAAAAAAVKQGRSVTAPSATSGRYRLLDPAGHLLGWGEADATRRIQPRAVFRP